MFIAGGWEAIVRGAEMLASTDLCGVSAILKNVIVWCSCSACAANSSAAAAKYNDPQKLDSVLRCN
jgi:hypothetical protein